MSRPARGSGLILTAIGAFAVVGAFADWTPLPHSARSAAATTAVDSLAGPTSPTPGRPIAEPARAPARVAPDPPEAPIPNATQKPRSQPSPSTGRLEPAASQVKPIDRFTVVPGPAAPAKARRLVRYTVEVERGVAVVPAEVAAVIDATLADKRSWTAAGYTFRRVGAGGDLRMLLATPGTVDKLCAPLLTRGQVSCRNEKLVVLNQRRWMLGAPAYGANIAAYRQYLVNHEVGHFLGHGHVSCPGPGRYAPVMLQQTLRLSGCRPNPWPALSRRR